MSRLMSVTLTEAAVVERRKHVTRRLGWLMLKPGDRLTLCRKVMGRRPGEKLVRLAEVEVVGVRREALQEIDEADIELEGVDPSHFDEHDEEGRPTPTAWVRWFCDEMRIQPDDLITRIEWRYLEQPEEDTLWASP